jgi:hypothetical protein
MGILLGEELLPGLRKAGYELDQQLRRALELASSHAVHDSDISLAPWRLNTIATRYIPVSLEGEQGRLDYKHADFKRVPIEEAARESIGDPELQT